MGKWLTGVLILALLSIFATLVWPFNANQRSAQMGTTIQNALNAGGMDFATVNMRGNVARLSGNAPNEAAMTAATELASTVKCEKCEGKKPWHKVVSDLDYTKMVTASPYVFNAVKAEDGSIVLDGYVRSEAEKARVLREAENLFPGKVANRTIKIAAGAPNADWGDVISLNLNEMAMLERGRFNMENDQSFISGLAADEATRAKVNAMVTGLPSAYNGASNISVPDAAAVNVGEVKSESICQTLFNELKGDNKINFAYNNPTINGAKSFDLLNALASAAKQCASFRVDVIGHTDSDGGEAYNQELSLRRANNVAAYLVRNGVELERLSYAGKGETAPIADNATPDGKAKNRRIEFIVTQAN